MAEEGEEEKKSFGAFIYSIRVNEEGHIEKDKFGLVVKHPDHTIETLYFRTAYDRARYLIDHKIKRVPLRQLPKL